MNIGGHVNDDYQGEYAYHNELAWAYDGDQVHVHMSFRMNVDPSMAILRRHVSYLRFNKYHARTRGE